MHLTFRPRPVVHTLLSLRPTAFPILAILTVGLAGCGVAEAEHARVIKERDSLATRLKTVSAALEDAKFGAPRLLSAAKTSLAEGNLEAARDTARQLLNRHAAAPEASDGKLVLAEAERKIEARASALRKAHDDSIASVKARLARAIGSMRKVRDDVQSYTFYYDRSSPEYLNSRSNIDLYIADPDDSSPALRFRIRYVAEDWLFIQSYTIKADERTFRIDVSGIKDVERDNGSGGIWEWYDTMAGGTELEIVRAIIASKKAVLRYEGRQYVRDRIITADEKAALQRVLVS